mmetsp:Transcript_6375/g.9525  ORF Transcript_6375/g.9525 Transcript_6375/m.9525 type:complete len:275 (-) Transcript_6375:159-983(-)|eukprot:CAMPEP_0197323456 /NCGR_PEP_ID=MMETSP0891-20130614/70533_1 /TAXON_ID=44058 ORGANISM="Aureoumbra lagunensis, Strain CCMP1510" /NCGR_SAMPLE_ID=MMETSP0891 /ASSEMBLY_ACC=CAM_ASM_000534 /LENGTH=274 /DNA_ID=CAMNT_0042816105 /DNA_START=70 /DNA_END=894 /DNA_ORIENTATION=+
MSSTSPPRRNTGRSSDALHKLDLSGFKARNSAILSDLEAQEQERNSLWAALQKAREDGELLKQEAERKEEANSSNVDEISNKEEVEHAPTSAELMAMICNEPLPLPPNQEEEKSQATIILPRRFARAAPVTKENPAILASGFICPTCWMRAPTAEVLRKHDEDVHQSHLEKATNRVLDNTGAIGNMTRVAFRRIRRSMSLAPPRAIPANTDDDEQGKNELLHATRQAAFAPAKHEHYKVMSSEHEPRRSSLPPPTLQFIIFNGSRARWRRHVIV